MASFVFEIEDEIAARIASAICAQNDYDPEMGITPEEFTKDITMRWLRQQTLDYEAQQAAFAIRSNQADPMVNPMVQATVTQE